MSKKERFKNAERPEPGQGGYWTINHNAPPPLRVRKRVTRRSIISAQQSLPGTSSSVPSSSGTLQWRPITARIHPRLERTLDYSRPRPGSPSGESSRRFPSYHPYHSKSSISAGPLSTTRPHDTTMTTASTTTSTIPYIYPRSESIYSPTYRSTIDNDIYSSGIGSSTSLFRSIPTERTPDGRLRGRHSRCIILPPVNPRHGDEVRSSSPRHWRYSESPLPNE